MIVQKDKVKHDNGMDKLKAILIICVIFGHILEEIRIDGVLGIIRSVIYSFHMPVFIFISGYFAKNVKRTYASAVSGCLIPFAIFNTLWLLLRVDSWWLYLLRPAYVFWFMLSLFFWRIFIPTLSKIRGILVFSFLLSLYIGLVAQADQFLSISRTIGFLPFFLLGFFCSEETLSRIRKIPHILCILLMCSMFFVTAVMNVKQLIPVKMYEFIQSYESCGVSGRSGIMQRGIILLIAVVTTLCLVNLAGEKENFLCRIGKRTAAIYLLSSFVIYAAFYIINKGNWMERIIWDWKLSIFLSAVLTAVVLLVCGNRYVHKGYHVVMSKITGIVLTYDERV